MRFRVIFIVAVFVMVLGAASAAAPQCDQTAATYAPWYCNSVNVAVYNSWSPWIPVAAAAILFSFFIAALAVMFGIAIRSEKIKNFGVAEIYEAVATTIIVVAFMFLAGVLIGVIPSGYVGNINPYNASLHYINNAVLGSEALFSGVFNVYNLDAYYASTQININTVNSKIDVTGPLASAIEFLILFPTQTIAQLISAALITLHVEFYLLLFAMEAAIPVFLIPGVIMRSILPTRPVGGILIGTGIALFVVMPLLFSVAFYFTNQGLLEQLGQQTAAFNAYGAGTGAQVNGASSNAPLVQELGGISSTISSFWLAVIFFPVLIMGITIATAMTIADFIGGTAQRSKHLMLGI